MAKEQVMPMYVLKTKPGPASVASLAALPYEQFLALAELAETVEKA